MYMAVDFASAQNGAMATARAGTPHADARLCNAIGMPQQAAGLCRRGLQVRPGPARRGSAGSRVVSFL